MAQLGKLALLLILLLAPGQARSIEAQQPRECVYRTILETLYSDERFLGYFEKNPGASLVGVFSGPPEVHVGNASRVLSAVRPKQSIKLTRTEADSLINKDVAYIRLGEQLASVRTGISGDKKTLKFTDRLNRQHYYELSLGSPDGDATLRLLQPTREVRERFPAPQDIPDSDIAHFDFKNTPADDLAKSLALSQKKASATLKEGDSAPLVRANRYSLDLLSEGKPLQQSDLEKINLLAGFETVSRNPEYAQELQPMMGIVRGTTRTVTNGSNRVEVNLKYLQIEGSKGEGIAFLPAGEVPQALSGWLKRVQGLEQGAPLVDIAKLAREFIEIHPFVDGNGRTQRILLDYMLMKTGYSPLPHGTWFSDLVLFLSPEEMAPRIKQALVHLKIDYERAVLDYVMGSTPTGKKISEMKGLLEEAKEKRRWLFGKTGELEPLDDYDRIYLRDLSRKTFTTQMDSAIGHEFVPGDPLDLLKFEMNRAPEELRPSVERLIQHLKEMNSSSGLPSSESVRNAIDSATKVMELRGIKVIPERGGLLLRLVILPEGDSPLNRLATSLRKTSNTELVYDPFDLQMRNARASFKAGENSILISHRDLLRDRTGTLAHELGHSITAFSNPSEHRTLLRGSTRYGGADGYYGYMGWDELMTMPIGLFIDSARLADPGLLPAERKMLARYVRSTAESGLRVAYIAAKVTDRGIKMLRDGQVPIEVRKLDNQMLRAVLKIPLAGKEQRMVYVDLLPAEIPPQGPGFDAAVRLKFEEKLRRIRGLASALMPEFEKLAALAGDFSNTQSDLSALTTAMRAPHHRFHEYFQKD